MGKQILYSNLTSKISGFISWIKNKIRITIYVLACNGPLSYFFDSLLKTRNLKALQARKISDTDSLELINSSSYVVEAPRWAGKPFAIKNGTFPPLNAHILKNSIVSAYSPAIINNNKIYFPSQLFTERDRILTDNANLFLSGKNFFIGRTNFNIRISKGILIGGAGAFNWYHFIMECLPKLFLAKKLPPRFKDYPLILPNHCKTIPTFNEALDIFLEGRQVHYLNRNEIALVDELVSLDEICIGPFNLTTGNWPRIDDYRQHDSLILSYISYLRSKILSSVGTIKDGRRIFLCRPDVRRTYNQDELVNIATNFGFERVDLHLLSLEEQAKILAEASAVIGPSGAGWVGIIFREQPMVGLSWLPKPYSEFCCYSTLGHLLGHQIDFIEAKTSRTLKSTGDAHTEPYQVCPQEFEKSMHKLIQKLQSDMVIYGTQ